MEHAIGDLGKGIRQPSNPFGNLAQLALQQVQINAMKAICPELDEDLVQHLPQYSCNLGQGYALLRPHERMAQGFADIELQAIQEVCGKENDRNGADFSYPMDRLQGAGIPRTNKILHLHGSQEMSRYD